MLDDNTGGVEFQVTDKRCEGTRLMARLPACGRFLHPTPYLGPVYFVLAY
jgi:hypothetical protein